MAALHLRVQMNRLLFPLIRSFSKGLTDGPSGLSAVGHDNSFPHPGGPGGAKSSEVPSTSLPRSFIRTHYHLF